jgi:hypothetical protein
MELDTNKSCPMTKLFRISSAAVLLACLAQGCSSGTTPPPAPNPAPNPQDQPPPKSRPVKPDWTVTVDELVKEYESNKKAAEEKYGGKVIEVTGKVLDADRLNSDADPQLTITEGPEDRTGRPIVKCRFSAGWMDDVMPLGNGQPVRIQGKLALGSGGRYAVPLTECVLVEAGPATAISIKAEDLTKEIAAGWEQAKEKYRNKTLIVTGTVADTGKDGNAYLFWLAGHDERAEKPLRVRAVDVLAFTNPTIKREVSGIAKGQAVRVKGKVRIEGPDKVSLEEIVFLK